MKPSFDFDAPEPLACELFHLEVLGPQHNQRDYAAWTSSMDHIHATRGFEHHEWPIPMTIEENLADMVMHAQEFIDRTGYTYSILDGSDVIGCVYIYPTDGDDPADAKVRSWVRASKAHLDSPIRESLATWLATAWPFTVITY